MTLNANNIFNGSHILNVANFLNLKKPKILVLTESECNKFDINILEHVFVDYKILHHENIERVCILIHRRYCTQATVTGHLLVSETNDNLSDYRKRSIQCLLINVTFMCFSLNIVGVYRSPSATSCATEKLLEYLNSTCKYCHCILGDFNFDLSSSWRRAGYKEVTSLSRRFRTEVITSQSRTLVNNNFTRVATYNILDKLNNNYIQRTSRTTIDLIMISDRLKSLSRSNFVSNTYSTGLDHRAVALHMSLYLKSKFVSSKHSSVKENLLSQFNPEQEDEIVEYLSNLNWDFTNLDVQEAYVKIEDNMCNTRKKFTKPYREFRKSFRINLSQEMIQLLKLKKRIMLAFKANPTHANLLIRNEVRNSIQRKIKTYQKKQLSKIFINLNSKSKIWSTIHKVNGKIGKKSSGPPSSITSDKVTYHDKAALRVLSTSFHSKARSLRHTISLSQGSNPILPVNSLCQAENFTKNLKTFTAPNTLMILDNLSKSHNTLNSNNGFSNADVTFLAKPLSVILKPFYELVISEASLPKINFPFFVIPKTKPLPKLPDCSDFRPIGLNNAILRPVISTVNNQLRNHLMPILDPCQNGYALGKSCITSIMCLFEFAFLHRKEAMYLNIYDFSAAFPSLDHDIFVNKLKSYNVEGKALDLLNSYASKRERVHLISAETTASSHCEDCGVIQGCTAAPLSFSILTNDIRAPKLTVGDSFRSKFADDTKDLVSANSWKQAKINSDLAYEDLKKCSHANFLTLNAKKFKIIPILTKANSKLVDCPLPSSCDVLKIHFDSYFDFRLQVDKVEMRLHASFRLIKSLKRILDVENLLIASNKILHGDLHYSMEFCLLVEHSYFDKLQKMIFKIGRFIIPNPNPLKKTSNKVVLHKLKLLPLKHMITIQTLLFWNAQYRKPAHKLLSFSEDKLSSKRIYVSKRKNILTCISSNSNDISPVRARLIDALELYKIIASTIRPVITPIRLGSLANDIFKIHLNKVFSKEFGITSSKVRSYDNLDIAFQEKNFKKRKI